MGNTNGNGTNGIQPTKELVNDYAETLAVELQAIQSQIKASKKAYEAQILARDYAICCNQKAIQAKTYYSNVENCVVTVAAKDAELLQANVATFIQMSEDLSKKIQDATKTIKDIKNGIGEVNTLVQSFGECIKEEQRCNPALHTAIINGLEEKKMDEFVTALETNSSTLLKESNITFDAMIDNSGIAKFINAASLNEFAEPLLAEVLKVKNDLAANLKDIGKNESDSQADLSKILPELSQTKMESYSAESEQKGLNCIDDEVCNYIDNYEELPDPSSSKNPCPKTPEEYSEDLHANCQKFVKSISQSNSSNGGSAPV